MSDRPASWLPTEGEEIESAPPTYDEQEEVATYSGDVAKGGDVPKERRMSAYSFADLPEVVPASLFDGAQVIPDNAHKEVVPGDDPQVVVSKQLPEVVDPGSKLPEVYDETGGKESAPADFGAGEVEKSATEEELLKGRRRICGLRVKWFVTSVVLLLALIVALGAGLGVGLQASSKPRYEPPANAFDGTKVSLGGLSRVLGDPSDLAMYFQHKDGSIRWMEQDAGNTWHGGNSSTIVALDGKPGTPISVVSYDWDGLDNWRVFYIDNTNTLRETWQATQTWSQGWELGLLNNLAVKAWDDPRAAMMACWYGTTSGANFSDGSATSTSAANVLFRVVYAKDATTFQELSFRADTQVWSPEGEITNIDATSTPACANGQPGTVDYLMVVDQQSNINVFWKDLSNTTNTTTHPANQWTNSSISIPNSSPGTTLAYNSYLFAQDSSTNKIKGYTITFDAENSSIDLDSAFEVDGDPGIPQTGIAVTVERDEFVLVYQTNSTSISNFNRGVDGGDWTVEGIQIPDD